MDLFSQRLSDRYDLLCELIVMVAVGGMLYHTHAEYGAGGLSLMLGAFVYSLVVGLPLALVLVRLKSPLFGLISLFYRPVELADR